MNNIVLSYIKYTQNFLYDYYRTLLDNSYEKKLVQPFIERYIEIRYYNNVYTKESNFVEKISKELKIVVKEMFEEYPNKEDRIKDIFALFGYILYLDDCMEYKSVSKLLDTLYNDENIHLTFSDEVMNKLNDIVLEYVNRKKDFWRVFDINDFELKYKRLKKNLFFVDLDIKLEMPIYSEYAIERAKGSEIVLENTTYLLYNMLCAKLLNDVINLDYTKRYVVMFPVSLFDKSKKSGKYLRLLDNDLCRDKINLCFNYKDYLNNKKSINELIKEGYAVSLILDDMFDGDYECLVLFNYVFVYEKYDYYDVIMEQKDNLGSVVVTLQEVVDEYFFEVFI